MCALTCARLSTHINTTFRQANDQQQQTYRDAQLSATHLAHYFLSLSAVFVGIGIGFCARASDSMQTHPGSDSHLRLFNPIGVSEIAIARQCDERLSCVLNMRELNRTVSPSLRLLSEFNGQFRLRIQSLTVTTVVISCLLHHIDDAVRWWLVHRSRVFFYDLSVCIMRVYFFSSCAPIHVKCKRK